MVDNMYYLDINKCQQRFNAMHAEANKNWMHSWMEIAKYVQPWRGFFPGQEHNSGARRDFSILSGASIRAAGVLANGLQSGLTSPARPWFKLTLNDPDLSKYDPVQNWLTTVTEYMMSAFSKSNAYNILHSGYMELGCFGTAAMYFDEHYDNIINGYCFTIGEYYISIAADGKVNSLARKIYMTPIQMIERFGYDNVSHTVQDMYRNNNVDKWFEVWHLIEPNDDRLPDLKDARNKPYRSVWWEANNNGKFLRVSGYNRFPIMAPRWDTVSCNVYGFSPGWQAIGDSKMLQKMQYDKLLALGKLVNPPMMAPATQQTTGGINNLPGGVTYYTQTSVNGDVIRPAYQINPDINGITQSIAEVKKDIGDTFFVDLFMMMAMSDRRDVTAREVAEKHEEKLLMLGPVIERLESELLDPLIDRVFDIMVEADMIPPPPPEIQGEEMAVEYVGLLSQAQKMVTTSSIQQFVGFVGSLTGVNPEVLDNVNFDEAVHRYGGMQMIPPGIVRGEKEVQQIRQARAKAQQAAAQQQQMLQTGMALAQGAKTLSDAKMDDNNALAALTGGL